MRYASCILPRLLSASTSLESSFVVCISLTPCRSCWYFRPELTHPYALLLVVVLEPEGVAEARAARVILRRPCVRLAAHVIEEKSPRRPDLVCEIGKVYRVPERTPDGRFLLAFGQVLFVRICPLHENGKEDHLRSFRRENASTEKHRRTSTQVASAFRPWATLVAVQNSNRGEQEMFKICANILTRLMNDPLLCNTEKRKPCRGMSDNVNIWLVLTYLVPGKHNNKFNAQELG
jgi:hypothetical protein